MLPSATPITSYPLPLQCSGQSSKGPSTEMAYGESNGHVTSRDPERSLTIHTSQTKDGCNTVTSRPSMSATVGTAVG